MYPAARRSAFASTQRLADPHKLTQSLMVTALLMDCDELLSPIAMSVSNGDYCSDQMAAALAYGLLKANAATPDPNDSVATRLHSLGHPDVLEAIGTTKSRKATQMLLSVLAAGCEGKGTNPYQTVQTHAPVALALCELGDMRIVPALMDLLAGRDESTELAMGTVDGRMSMKAKDLLIYCAVKLTKQSLSQYGIQEFSQNQMHFIGFATNDAREEAVKKLRQWWEDNKVLAPYRELHPLEVLQLAQVAKNPYVVLHPEGSAAATKPSSSRPTDRLDMAAVSAAAPELAKQLTQASQKAVDVFRTGRVTQRQAAAEAVMALYRAYVTGVAGELASSTTQVAAIAGESLERVLSEARFNSFIGTLSSADRTRVFAFRKANSELVSSVFSARWKKSLAGIRKLGSSQGDDGDPILVYCLSHSSPEVLMAAAEAVASGKFKSDAVIDRLNEIIANGPPQWWQRMVNSPKPMFKEHAAYVALMKIHSPRSTGTVLALLLDKRPNFWHDCYSQFYQTDLLATIGDKRALPVLLARMGDQNQTMSSTINGKQITSFEGDAALLAAIRISGQDAKDFKMLIEKWGGGSSVSVFGFAAQADREEARKKMRAWWEKNKDAAENKDLGPLVVPTLKDNQQQPNNDDILNKNMPGW